MNPILQCMAHIKPITEHILNLRKSGKLKDTKKYRLSEAYSEVLWEIWLPKDKQKRDFSPYRFKKIIEELNPLFDGFSLVYPKDLLEYFIEKVHTELNQAEDKTNPNITIPDYINPSNNIEVFGYFIKEYIKKHKSIFSSYFHGLNHLISTCNRCQTQTHSYNLFSFIILPLLEVKKMVTSEGNYPKNFRNYFDLSIEDCFLYAQKKGFYKGDKKCNKCQFESDYWLEKKL